MSEAINNIGAPEGLYRVMVALGESRTDVYTLCTSPKINPDSLIRPLYFRSEVPGTDPAQFSKADTESNRRSLFLPTGKESEVADITINHQDTTNFPTLNKYDIAESLSVETLHWEAMPYGFFVPYVDKVQAVPALADKFWKRFGVEDSPKSGGKLTENFGDIIQFDGYQPGAKAESSTGVSVITAGAAISYTPYMPSENEYKREKIYNLLSNVTSLNNPGGVVNVPAVFGEQAYPGNQTANFHYGVSLYRKGIEDNKFTLVVAMITSKTVTAVEGTTGRPIMQDLTMTGAALTNADYIMIPWLCKGTPNTNAKGELIIGSQPSLRFYGMRFSKNVESFDPKQVRVPCLHFGPNAASMYDGNGNPATTGTKPSITFNGRTIHVTAMIGNPYLKHGDTPGLNMRASAFTATITGTYSDGSNINIVDLSPTGSVHLDLPFKDKTIMQIPLSQTIEMDFVLSKAIGSITNFTLTFISTEEKNNYTNFPVKVKGGASFSIATQDKTNTTLIDPNYYPDYI